MIFFVLPVITSHWMLMQPSQHLGTCQQIITFTNFINFNQSFYGSIQQLTHLGKPTHNFHLSIINLNNCLCKFNFILHFSKFFFYLDFNFLTHKIFVIIKFMCSTVKSRKSVISVLEPYILAITSVACEHYKFIPILSLVLKLLFKLISKLYNCSITFTLLLKNGCLLFFNGNRIECTGLLVGVVFDYYKCLHNNNRMKTILQHRLFLKASKMFLAFDLLNLFIGSTVIVTMPYNCNVVLLIKIFL